MYNDYLCHYGVLGMKWGIRRAVKRRSKYLDKTKRMSESHKSNASQYSKNAKKLRFMSDSDYAKRFDDPEYLRNIGGVKKAKATEIKDYESRSSDSSKYARKWMNAHDAIMKTSINDLKTNKDYEKLIDEYLNR